MRKFLSVAILVSFAWLLTACSYKLKPSSTNQPSTNRPQTTNGKENSKTLTDDDRPETSISNIDNIWNLFSHSRLGWQIKFPKKYALGEGDCYWDEEQKSYRPKTGIISTQVFENSNSVSFKPEYIYKLSGEASRNGYSYFSKCEKEIVTADSTMGWKLVWARAQTDGELEGFIKQEYGQGCLLEVKKPTKKPQVFDVIIGYLGKGDGDLEQMEKNDCFVNYMYTIKYNEQTKVVVSWKLGQAFEYFKDVNIDKGAYDEEMLNSFEFIN